MMSLRRRAALLAVAATFVATGSVGFVPASAAGASEQFPVGFTKHTFPMAGGPGSRDYWVFVPAHLPAGRAPLVVFLHGCTQTASDAAVGTRFNDAATRRGFIVAYPEQRLDPLSMDGNGTQCWNWFASAHQSRGSGEPATIAGITATVAGARRVDADRTYVAGISAGADMAGIMAATYPDVFAAAGIVAGCAYLTCADVSGTSAYAAMGTHHRPVPVLVEQGTADVLNNVALGETAIRQWLGTNDLADDGVANGSTPSVPTTTETHHFDDISATGTGGDACVRNQQFPCAGGVVGLQGSYPYTVDHHVGPAGCSLVDAWLVQGLAHDYPGGDPRGTFTDPIGPDLTNGLVDFFLAHPKTTTGCPRRAVSSAPVAGASPPTTGRSNGGARPVRAAGRDSTLPATGGRSGDAVAGAGLGLVALALRRMGRAAPRCA